MTLATVQITSNNDETHNLTINGHDLSMIADRVEIFLDANSPRRYALVSVWVPASLAVDIPADLVIFVDYPDMAQPPKGIADPPRVETVTAA